MSDGEGGEEGYRVLGDENEMGFKAAEDEGAAQLPPLLHRLLLPLLLIGGCDWFLLLYLLFLHPAPESRLCRRFNNDKMEYTGSVLLFQANSAAPPPVGAVAMAVV